MWGKSAIAFVFWLATVVGVTKLFHALPHSPGRDFYFHDSVTMILAGCSLLLLAMAIKKFSLFFSRNRSTQKNLKNARRRDPGRLISSFQSGE